VSPDDVTFAVVDAASAAARRAMGRYFDELDRRFTDGFDPTGAFEDAAIGLNPPNGVFVVVVRGERVIGCGGIQHHDDATAEIKRMWIDDDSRGVGLGRRLLAHLEGRARDAGRTRVILDTNGVLTEAIAMYRSSGYEPTERYNDNPYAQHWFAKGLAGGG
jgi:GNAT superfamily N-acetyltransferase